MRFTIIWCYTVAMIGCGYLIHQPKSVDHYVMQETIKHDCAVSVLATKFPRNVGVSYER